MKRPSRGILIGALVLLSAGLVWQQQRLAGRTKADGAAPPGGRAAVPEPAPVTSPPAKDGVSVPGLTLPAAAGPLKSDRGTSPASASTPRPPAASAADPDVSPPHPAMDPEPLISQAGTQSLIARDGTPLRMEIVPGQAGSALQLQAWTEDQNRNTAGQYPWRFKIKMAAGGLQERTDPTGFLAPDAGYLPDAEYVMDPAEAGTAWQNTLSKSFFVRLEDGTYGLLNLQMVAGGAHFVTVKSYLNPATGSRNLTLPPRPVTKTR